MCELLESVQCALKTIENDSISKSPELLEPAGPTSPEILEPAGPTLLNLPVEIFLKICSYIDADFISKTLSNVCKRFKDILADIELWRYWVNSRIKNTYPALPHLKVWAETELNWEEACIDIDREFKKWIKVEQTTEHVVVRDVHYASVDAVLLINQGKLCVSGGRDRGIALWKVPSLTGGDTVNFVNTKPEKMRNDAHSGWVWDLAADMQVTSTVYSASWDNTVKAWDVETGLTCLETFLCGMSALSLVTCENIVLAGLYSKEILSFDIRSGPKQINSYKAHKGPILDLVKFGSKVASISEDKTLAVWDQVAGKLIASDIKLATERAYPVCLSWSPAALYIGDSKGSLHLIDPEQLVYNNKHKLWAEPEETLPPHKITGCHQSLGSMIVCSDRGDIKLLYNSYPPQEYMTLKTSTYDVTQLQYQNGVLVVGTCDSALEFWLPK